MARQNVTGDENEPRPASAHDAPAAGDVPGDAEELARFLATAPPELRGWAQRQARAAGVDTDRDALAELGEDDLDDDPILPGRAGAGRAPAASAPGASGPTSPAPAVSGPAGSGPASPTPAASGPTPASPAAAGGPVVEVGDADTNRDALAELGEDDLDDDPILPGRAGAGRAPATPAPAAPVPATPAAAPAAPSHGSPTSDTTSHHDPGQAPGDAATTAGHAAAAAPAEGGGPGRPGRPSRHSGPAALPTAPLIHTPTAAQAARPSAGDPVNPYPAAGAQKKKGVSPLVALVLVVLIAVAVVTIQQLGGGGDDESAGTPAATDGAVAATQAPVDPQAVADLEAALEQDPDNTGTMTSLADLYYATGDYANAARWMNEVVQREPQNASARTFLGVLHFNQGDVPAAEEQWNAAIEADPEYVEAHYNLGFAYLASEPQRTAQAEEAWGRVLEISPNSNLADIVRSHLSSLTGGDAGAESPGAESPGAESPAGEDAPAGNGTEGGGGTAGGDGP